MGSFGIPQTWIFPAPHQNASQGFGPVSLHDTIILAWTPPTEEPAVSMWCDTPSGHTSTIPLLPFGYYASPKSYTFDTPANATAGEEIVCHLWFPDSTDGNSVQFQYNNDPASTPSTWAAGNKTILEPMVSFTNPPAYATPTSSSQSLDHSTPLILSPSQKTGIALGCLALVLIFVAAVSYCSWERRRRINAAAAPVVMAEETPPPYSTVATGKPPGYAVDEVVPTQLTRAHVDHDRGAMAEV